MRFFYIVYSLLCIETCPAVGLFRWQPKVVDVEFEHYGYKVENKGSLKISVKYGNEIFSVPEKDIKKYADSMLLSRIESLYGNGEVMIKVPFGDPFSEGDKGVISYTFDKSKGYLGFSVKIK